MANSNYLPFVAERLLGRPLLIAPTTAEAILSVVHGRIDATGGTTAPDASQFIGSRRRPNGYALTRAQGNTALISVIGSLVNRGAWIDANCGLTSYEGLAAQVREATADSSIQNIILDIDSPGGEATGMFGVTAAIRAARKTKRVTAVVNDLAASAAYGIASAADEIVISPTSVVGSIGVVMLHLDRSGEMEKRGVAATFIHAGAHKVDGHPFGPLPDDVRADLQRDVMTFYDRFLETVDLGRGTRLTAAAARATEAKTYIGRDAIAAGLADRLGTVEEILADLSAKKPAPSKQKGTTMLPHEASSDAIAQAKAEERSRIKAILASPEAQGRQHAALNLALSSDVTLDATRSILGSLPLEATKFLPPEARDTGRVEIGPNFPIQPAQEQVAAGWKSAFARVQASR